MPVGIGDTVFEKLDANLAKAMLSIGAVKGFEIGDGFKAADTKEVSTMIPSIQKMEGSPKTPTMQAVSSAV